MRVVITGTPGTGKTAIAKLLAPMLGARLVDIAHEAREGNLVKKGEVDVRALGRRLVFLRREKSFVAEGHLACELKLPADHVIVLRCKPETLARRLGKRKYAKKKLQENLMAEALDYCTQRSIASYGKAPLELETSGRSAAECARIIASAVKNKKKALDNVDYSHHLLPRS